MKLKYSPLLNNTSLKCLMKVQYTLEKSNAKFEPQGWDLYTENRDISTNILLFLALKIFLVVNNNICLFLQVILG